MPLNHLILLHPLLLLPSIFPSKSCCLLFSHSALSNMFVTPWTITHQAPLSMGFPRQRILEWVSISFSRGSSWPRGRTCISYIPGKFFTPEPPRKPHIRVFPNKSVLCMKWPQYWSFSFSISPSNEYSGLISLRMDCSELLAVQGTVKNPLQCHNWKASIFSIHLLYGSTFTSIHDYWKNHSFDYTGFCWQNDVSTF